MANWLSRVVQWVLRRSASEGEVRPGPYFLSGGWLSAKAGRYVNWWQKGYSLTPYGESAAMVEACVSAYAQTVAMCPGAHWRVLSSGGRERVENSALTRILRKPNDYQSISDFMLNLTRNLYLDGEAFALCVQNGRGEIDELHLMKYGAPFVAAADGSIFYRLAGNDVAEYRFNMAAPVPARNVLHVRLHTPRHPLKGESPILSTTLDRALAGAALNQQVAFFLNEARPSFTLETDQQLTKDQIAELRARWNEQTQGENAGGTPILAWGLKAKNQGSSARDAQLAELLKMSDQNVALAFRVPLQVFGIGGNTFSSTELLMQSWIASGLGFCLNHIEEAFGQIFGLKGQPDEYLEFDTRALLRSAFRERIEGLVRGVIGGVFSPDEARKEVELPAVPGGHGSMPRVQQQVVPLSYGTSLKAPEPGAPPATPADPPEPTSESEIQSDDQGRGFDDYTRQIDELAERYSQNIH